MRVPLPAIKLSLLALVLVGSFQNCGAYGSVDSVKLKAIQSAHPEVTAIEPMQNVSITDNGFLCVGSCAIFFRNGVVLGGSISCDGALTTQSNVLTCTNNLAMRN